MNREEIISQVKAYTNHDTDEVTNVCQNHIDLIQDNEICSNIYGHDFSFLTDYAEINTIPVYNTGTVSVVQDSTTVTGTGTGWTSAMAGRIIKFSNDNEYYEIASIDVGAQAITLTSAYIGVSANNISYNIYKVYYELPQDFKKMKWAKQIVSPEVIIPIREFTMAGAYTNEFRYSGNIRGYVISGISSSNIPQIRFYPIQTNRSRVYICYVKGLPSINSVGAVSKIPSKWHMLFVYKLSEIVFDMHSMPSRALKEAQKFEKMLQAFIREDRAASKDAIDTMQNQFLIKTIAHPVLPQDHYANV